MSNFEYEIVLNPDNEVYLKFMTYYRSINWACLSSMYQGMLNSYKNGNLKFYVAIDKNTKTPLSSILIGKHESKDDSIELICIGKYFTIPSKRGSGIAQQLWLNALNEYKNKNLSLIGASAMHEKYSKKYGFNKYYTSDIIVHARLFKDINIDNLKDYSDTDNFRIVDFNDISYDKLIKYDYIVTGKQRRDTFLKTWLNSEEILYKKIAVDNDDNVIGYIAIANMENFYSFCPFFAVNQNVASTLLKSCLQYITNNCKLSDDDKFRTTSFEKNQLANDLFDQLTDKKKFLTKLYGQFTQYVPDVQYNQVYCLTELAINVI